MEFPEKKANSWERFAFSFYMRGGGEGLDLNYLIFHNGDFTYKVYEEYSAADDKKAVGIRIKNEKTGKEYDHLTGDPKSIIGSLVSLRFSHYPVFALNIVLTFQ